jgi:large subunit ribosomal protein L18
MAKKHQQKVAYRRKREGRTNYRKRLKLLMTDKPRLVIRKSNRHLMVQVVSHAEQSDRVIVTARTHELSKLGWTFATGSIPAAYLTGYLAGKKSIAKGQSECIVDIGLQSKAARLFAAVKGAIDAGMNIAIDESILPSKERIEGSHIASYAAHLSKDTERYKKQFGSTEMKDITRIFAHVKEQIK